MSQEKPKVIVVLGPTASGKSAMAVALAKRYGGEVVSADSRQVYRGMDVGTGKITEAEQKGIPHHLLDVASPRKSFGVARYQKIANRAINGIARRGRIPIICGGTGLYIDSLIYGFVFPEVKPDLFFRKKLAQKTAMELFAELQVLDPERAKHIDPKNPRRLIRALEIVQATGGPVPVLRRDPAYPALIIGIQVKDEVLRKKVARRLRRRLRQGMVREVKRLHSTGLSWQKLDELGLEYRYVSRYLQGILSRKEMEQILEKEIWRYAKRQMTWFKRDKNIHWIDRPADAVALAGKFLLQK